MLLDEGNSAGTDTAMRKVRYAQGLSHPQSGSAWASLHPPPSSVGTDAAIRKVSDAQGVPHLQSGSAWASLHPPPKPRPGHARAPRHHLLSAHKRCEVQIVAHYLRNPFALNRETQDLFCEGSTWPSSSADCNVLTWLFMYLEIHHMLQKIATQRLWLLSSCSGL